MEPDALVELIERVTRAGFDNAHAVLYPFHFD